MENLDKEKENIDLAHVLLSYVCKKIKEDIARELDIDEDNIKTVISYG